MSFILTTVNLLLNPLFHLFIFISLFAILLFKKINKARYLFIFIIFYLFTLTSPLIIYLYATLEEKTWVTEPLDQRDAVIILGGGSLTYYPSWDRFSFGSTIDRVLGALELYHQQKVRKIIVSGGDPGGVLKNAYGEAPSTVTFLRKMGVKQEDILIEDKSLNTFEEAKYLKELLPQWGIKTYYMVTSANHMMRSLQTFQHHQLNPRPYSVQLEGLMVEEYKSRWRISNLFLWRSFLHELVGLFYYKVKNYS